MRNRCIGSVKKAMDIFFISVILLVSFMNKSSASQQNPFCRQGVFKKSAATIDVNIAKQVSVISVLECAQLCLAQKSCEVFKYRDANHDAINCQVTQGKPEYFPTSEKDYANEKWKLYTLQIIESPKCIRGNLCHGAGRCLADSCEPEGFKCECKEKYYGKYCQYEKYHNYDIVFPNTTENNFLVLGTVNKDFDEFTFSAWIKFNPGFMIYPLMSYTSKSSAETIALAFYADDASRGSIKSFSGNLFGHHKGTATIPINDGYWHHVGFTWSSGTGQWMLLIDGVLWANRNTLKGKKIQSGGILEIGKITHKKVSYTLVGSMSEMNLWSEAKNGSEIELIAKRSGPKEGDLIAWFTVKDYVVSRQKIIRPSNASFSGEGLNYEMTVPLSSQINYPGPSEPVKFLSSCLWVKNGETGNAKFFAYDTTSTFSFRYRSGNKLAFTLNSLSGETSVTCGGWHFLCMKWNGKEGKASLFYDGYQSGNSFEDPKLTTELPAGRNFILGLSGDSATLTQLNVWDYEITTESIYPMSAGGFNIHGNMLSWGSLAKYVTENIAWNTDVYLPGFTVLDKRTKWCFDNIQASSSCPDDLLARLGGHKDRENMQWRCYCPSSLVQTKFTYNFSSLSPSYFSRHSELTAIND